MTFEDSGPRNLREPRILPKVAVRPPVAIPARPIKKRCATQQVEAHGRSGQRGCQQGGTRFYSILTEEQIRTVEMIARGFQYRTSGIGMRTQSFSALPPSTGNNEERQSDLVRRFMRWAVSTQKEGLSVAAVLDIIVFGKSFRTVDRERQKRNGFARSQLLDSLELYGRCPK